MGKFTGYLFSPVLMGIILIVFAVSIGSATFIERFMGTSMARTLVYNARWFEILLLLGTVNLTGRIVVQKLYLPSRFPVFLFHISFVVILCGAALTRYTGWEGLMSIREGNQSNQVVSDRLSLQVKYHQSVQMEYSFHPNQFHAFEKSITINDQVYLLKGKEYTMADISLQSTPEGKPAAELILVDSVSRIPFLIKKGETKIVNGMQISFDGRQPDQESVMFMEKDDSLYVRFPDPVAISGMNEEGIAMVEGDHFIPMRTQQIYHYKNKMLVILRYDPHAKYYLKSASNIQEASHNALILEISGAGNQVPLIIAQESNVQSIRHDIVLNGDSVSLNFGFQRRFLPFSLLLNDFILERYPGSQSPSSFESRVTLVDKEMPATPYRIYMNNILKYKGYRFYQTSYDPDERGTILSVNKDSLGTSVTYSGYVMLALGIIVSLFRKKGRLRVLSEEIIQMKKGRNALLIMVFMLSGFYAQGNDLKNNTIPAGHAEMFGKLLIQDAQGRIEPVNTLSSEVIRKIYKKNIYKGLNSDQVLIGMISNPEFWQNEPVIKVGHPGISALMGRSDKYLPYASFFNDKGYVLQSAVETSYRKTPALRNRFDNELIKVDERVNICYMVFTGQLLRFFPVRGDSSHTWYNHETVKGRVPGNDSVFVENIIYLYVQDVQQSMQSGNWKSPDDIVHAIGKYQRHTTDPSLIPSETKLKMEVLLNKLNPFSRISNYYGLIGFILLVLQIMKLFYPGYTFKIPIRLGMVMVILLFSIHTLGMILRWYLSGHAPWSNGYETLIYVAWATVLAGLIFASKSPMTMSVAPVIAFITLKIAHLSWMDPQITHLVPVLKSYWLIIHVATISASYGFLIMGALLGFVNLVIMILKHQMYTKSIIREITCTIEMALLVGLALLTTGIFLGAVWANESWGRYWGWDPKETWALVTMLVYAFILHMRMIPGLKSDYSFNLASLLGVGSVIMTYFGVNYYLSGLHSYAKGDPLPIPSSVYIILITIIITAVAAYFRKQKLENAER